jgi:hypothetical protein
LFPYVNNTVVTYLVYARYEEDGVSVAMLDAARDCLNEAQQILDEKLSRWQRNWSSIVGDVRTPHKDRASVPLGGDDAKLLEL